MYKLDVVMVSETHFNANNQDPKISGYTLYRTDRGNGRGGSVAIKVQNSFNYFLIELSKFETMEATAINLEGGKMTLDLCYLAFGKILQESDLSVLKDCSQIFIGAGDFNDKRTDLGCQAANGNGVTLSRLSDLTNDTVVLTPKELTPFLTRGVADLLDIALLKNVRDNISKEVVTELSSDHHPVLFFLGKHPE